MHKKIENYHNKIYTNQFCLTSQNLNFFPTTRLLISYRQYCYLNVSRRKTYLLIIHYCYYYCYYYFISFRTRAYCMCGACVSLLNGTRYDYAIWLTSKWAYAVIIVTHVFLPKYLRLLSLSFFYTLFECFVVYGLSKMNI